MNKVPHITLAFWIMKICATTLGETAGDLVSMTLAVGYAVSTLIFLAAFIVALSAQLLSKSFHPLLYWSVIVSTSTAGTTISDFMDRTLGLGYVTGSLILVSTLVAALVIWKLVIGSLSVSNIRSPKIEIFYWATILISNTLGTAFGDFLADSSGFGFAGGALLVASAVGVIALLHFHSNISKTVLFWIAFVLTRPLGAMLGDLLTKTHDKGGMELGTMLSSAILASMLIATIFYSRKENKDEAARS